MKRTGLTTRHWLATLALTTLVWAAPGQAQSPSTPQQPPYPTPTQNPNQGDITAREVALMNGFLENRPEILEQLQANPKLIDDPKFVASHPELQQFLAEHPEIRQQFDEHPYAFLHDEDRYGGNHDISPREVALMDNFLKNHPEILEQLQKDPHLIDDQKFVADHPELQSFLKDHPELATRFDEFPGAFMRDEDRYLQDHPDISGREIAIMNSFLVSHPEIAEQLQKDPKLIDDQKWVANHPELQQFLAQHPEVRQQFDEHPYAFMNGEDKYDQHHDITDREVAMMDGFLNNHPEISEQLQKNPKLIDDQKWVASHPELQQFLSQHPELRQQFDEHPYAFMRDEDQYNRDNPDITHREVALMGAFLKDHPEIDEQLQKDPKLIDDKTYVANHPELQQFMADHPEVRQQFDEHPYAFMRDEDQIDHGNTWKSTHDATTSPGTATKSMPKLPGSGS
jgi:hypothetical protein